MVQIVATAGPSTIESRPCGSGKHRDGLATAGAAGYGAHFGTTNVIVFVELHLIHVARIGKGNSVGGTGRFTAAGGLSWCNFYERVGFFGHYRNFAQTAVGAAGTAAAKTGHQILAAPNIAGQYERCSRSGRADNVRVHHHWSVGQHPNASPGSDAVGLTQICSNVAGIIGAATANKKTPYGVGRNGKGQRGSPNQNGAGSGYIASDVQAHFR